MSKVVKTILFAVFIALFFSEASAWRRRRRRRSPPPPPPCQPRDCTVSSWSNYGSCSYPCGTSGVQWRSRYVTRVQSCGGQCPYNLHESKACNRGLCANHGTPHSSGCYCRAGYTGTCCQHGESIWLVYFSFSLCPKLHECFISFLKVL